MDSNEFYERVSNIIDAIEKNDVGSLLNGVNFLVFNSSSKSNDGLQTNMNEYSNDYISYLESKAKEVKDRIIEHSRDYDGLVRYLNEPDNDTEISQFKYYILTYLTSNTKTKKLLFRYRIFKWILLCLNLIIVIIIIRTSNDSFGETAMPWIYNTKEMIQAIPYQFYPAFYYLFVSLYFATAIILFLGWFKTEFTLSGNEEDSYKKELIMYTTNYENAKKIIRKKISNKIILKVALDIFILGFFLLNTYNKTLTNHRYGLYLFIFTAATIIGPFLLSIISLLKARNIKKQICSIYEEEKNI